jgi:hypothetical protein
MEVDHKSLAERDIRRAEEEVSKDHDGLALVFAQLATAHATLYVGQRIHT